MICLRNMCVATLNKGDNNIILIIIIIIIIIYVSDIPGNTKTSQ